MSLTKGSPNRERRVQHPRALLASVWIGALLLTMIVLGHDGRRIGQLSALAAPALLLMLWPMRSPVFHYIRISAIWLWAMVFVLDSVARAYLLDAYQAAPDSSFVQYAVANTSNRETSEYLASQWRAMAVWSAAIVLAGILIGRLVTNGARRATRWTPWVMAIMSLAILVGSVAYLSKPWRRLHPVVFWAKWGDSVGVLRKTWANQQTERDLALAHARLAAPVVTRDGPATMVLVITDSINRDNMALYGYKRATTPRLLAQKAQFQDQMLVMRNAWSVDASTLPSLQNIFRYGQAGNASSQHLLTMARAAGYKVWWMSNHDDVAIEQQHGKLADVVEIVNRVPGRAGGSLDGELLDCVKEALEDPAELKLIVLHLMGAHPHYNLRFPAGENPFDNQIDDVEKELEKEGRSAWVRKFRQEYDSALLYHDFVVSETLQMTRRIGRVGQYRAWMYLSDHGQEVGHSGNHAGHSPATASGYRIPTLIWRNTTAEKSQSAIDARPFRADWAGWTISNLLNLRWGGDDNQRNALSEEYRWERPKLPVKVESFVD